MLRLALRTTLLLAIPSMLLAQPPGTSWRFAVSGDSRNCGDIVMPAIAESVKTNKATFYWHLGDFRVGYDVDEDMRIKVSAPDLKTYQDHAAWDDFLKNQREAFEPVRTYLGIGNHETYLAGDGHEEDSRKAFIERFKRWTENSSHAYFKWTTNNVLFLSMDNSMNDGFDKEQLAWLDEALASDGTKPEIKAVVVGMHRALPNSLACGHSMNGDPLTKPDQNAASLASGRAAYIKLWKFVREHHKHVYVLASHSHFFMEHIYDTSYWHDPLASFSRMSCLY